MYGFCRLGLRPAPSSGAACTSNGLETKTSRKAKKVATPPSTGTVHGSRRRIRSRFRVTASEPSAVRTNSQSRSVVLLAAPEACPGVRERELARGVVGDIREGEVARVEGVSTSGDGGRGEGDERVACGLVKPAAAVVGGEAPRDHGVEGEPEGDEEGGSAEVGHGPESSCHDSSGFRCPPAFATSLCPPSPGAPSWSLAARSR